MATGEGKTVATALAAGVAALAGVPVHVLTANDYLVQRDAENLTPFYAALGLSCGAVTQATPRAERLTVYRRAVVYVTAKELGFDYLRDHHQLGGARDPRLLRALAMGGAGAAAPRAAGPVPGAGRRGRQPAARRGLRAADPGHPRRRARHRVAAARLRRGRGTAVWGATSSCCRRSARPR